MGSDPKKDEYTDKERETPQHGLELPDYFLARYPVTVAQYTLFVEQSGYASTNARSLKGTPNHPVVYVTWYDCLEYCKWLDERLKKLSPQKVRVVQDQEQLAFWRGLAENRLHVTLPEIPVAAIAQAEGITPVAVRKRLAKAFHLLAASLEQRLR